MALGTKGYCFCLLGEDRIRNPKPPWRACDRGKPGKSASDPRRENVRLSCRTERCCPLAIGLAADPLGMNKSRLASPSSGLPLLSTQASPTWDYCILKGAWRTPNGKPFVAAPGLNTKLVNRSAPELFPVTNLINKQFIPAAITSRRACFPAGSKSGKPLKYL